MKMISTWAVLLEAALSWAAIVPEQVHVAFADDGAQRGMAISWFTPVNTTSVVHIGVKAGVYDRTVTGPGSISYYPDTYLHHVPVKGLTASTRYYYVVGDTSGWSKEFSFMTSPADGSQKRFSVAIIGDMGLKASETTFKVLSDKRNEYDWVYHVGDMTYADDDFIHPASYETIWNQWASEMQPIAASAGYMVLPGNHEASCRSVGSIGCDKRHDNFTAYRYRWRMPAQESGGSGAMWYSFNYGPAHFISISTETDFPNSPEGPGTLWNAGPFGDQLGWLKKDLAEANKPENRAKRPWVIVSGHRPMYSTGTGDYPFNARANLRTHLEPLLSDFKVDLYLTAHVHGYERSYPICPGGKLEMKGYDNPKCLIHLLNGAAGNVEGHGYFDKPQNYTAYVNNKDFGFAVLDIFNSTLLSWRFMRGDGMLDDSFSLSKKH